MAEVAAKLSEVKRIAFLGGAFDPPHLGHEMLARKVLDLNLSDWVLWVPSWAPPHKCSGRMIPYEHRMNMARIAAAGIKCTSVSDIEARKKFDPSYSYKVLAALAEENPHAELQLLIGQDSLEQLHSWYQARDLVRKYQIITLPRRADSASDAELYLPDDFWSNEERKILQKSLISGEYIEISSTELRKKLVNREKVQHIINPNVLEYIEEYGLYR